MNIVEQIFASPEGGTASLNGGKLPVYGYFVGGLVSPLILDGTSDAAGARDEIEAFVAYLAESTDAGYAGWWTDEETGKVYVNGVDWYGSEMRAADIGHQRREIAVYDIADQRELRLM